jgi:CubicO group peptidase (beta-lactamase class C family)
LFERYLDSLREEAGIPGLSALISQDGVVVWERAFGRQNVEAATPATLETPYPIAGLSQTIGATLLLRKCFDQGHAEMSDRVIRWAPNGAEADSTLQALLTHASDAGTYRFSLARFGALTPVIQECGQASFANVAADEIFDRLGMSSTAPGQIASVDRFDEPTIERYAEVLRRVAVPYRLDSKGKATRNETPAVSADAATGIVSTVRDLARFDAALGAGVLLAHDTLVASWSRASGGATLLPTGLGWFVQNYHGEAIVWQFGTIPGGYSSLIIKAPNRGATLILLANSDGLNAPFALENGDVTTSIFAQLFLRLLVP